jgi:hypothetical protein
MEIPALNLVVVDTALHTNILAAYQAAQAAPGGAVWIPNSYVGTDTVPVNPTVPVFDMRSQGTTYLGSSSSNNNVAATASAAAAVVGSTGGTFVTTLNLPGGSKFNGVPFKVKAAGWTSFGGGTWTATIVPVLYASGLAGYTASASAIIFTAAATNVTIATALAATLKYANWETETVIEGDTTSAKITGRVKGSINNGAVASIPATAANGTWDAIANPTTVGTLNMAATVPIQFLAGVILGGTPDTGAVQTSTLTSFYIQS